MIRYSVLIFISVLLGCSSSQKKYNDMKIEFKILSTDAWLNLMPGNPGKFFIQGEAEIFNHTDEQVDIPSLKNILVYSDSILIYTVDAYLTADDKNPEQTIAAGSSRKFRFGTNAGLNMKESLLVKDTIDVIFNFAADSKLYRVEKNGIILERAY